MELRGTMNQRVKWQNYVDRVNIKLFCQKIDSFVSLGLRYEGKSI